MKQGNFLQKLSDSLEESSNKIITELPVGLWTDDYKKYIEDLIDGGDAKNKTKKNIGIKDYTDMSTDVNVDITLVFHPGKIAELQGKSLENDCNALEKLLKLYTTRTTTNMHMFDETEKLRKYETPGEIADPVSYTHLTLPTKA